MDNLQIEKWACKTVLQMTLKEKVSMLAGKDNWSFVDIKRLGIPSIGVIDGPHGVRYRRDDKINTATSFPTGVSMASSWDPELIERVGEALGEETAAHNCDILLGPCVNIARTPLAGRNFESFSEDPYLAGEIGVGYVKGVQSKQIGTSLKHFACNNQEYERFRGSSEVDERTLREIYLPAFETIVKQTQPWSVMCSYNRLNGVHASENKKLLTDILKDEWGFEGLVVSDWFATHSIFESVKAGLDVEMPGPAKYHGALLEEAVKMWQIEEELVNNAVIRILKVIAKTGKLDNGYKHSGSINTKEHKDLAKKLAEESIVLLKNENQLLPLKKGEIKSIAVIGINAMEARIGGGGSSYLEPPNRTSPLNAIRAELSENVKVKYEIGCDNFEEFPIIPSDYFEMPDEERKGVKVSYYNSLDCSGEILKIIETAIIHVHWSDIMNQDFANKFSSRWETKFSLPAAGRYGFKIKCHGRYKMYINGKVVAEGEDMQSISEDYSFENGLAVSEPVFIEGKENEKFDIVVEYIKDETVERSWLEMLGAFVSVESEESRIDAAVELAKDSDTAIVFAGMPKGFESENDDRPHMNLPGLQNELIEAVAAANKKTIVVLNTGVPITMPWINKVDAVVEAYYPGQEGGIAISNVLFGNVNPSGKLTVTFPKNYEDNPTFINYPGDRKVYYGEGIYVGYRYYDKKNVEPLFPFGHGLSYTSFAYSNMKITEGKTGTDYTVSVDITNTGKVAGREVVQLYVRDIESSVHRPVKELKGFQKVLLEPGKTKTVNMTLNERSFAFYDTVRNAWVVEPGKFEIILGSSCDDIRESQIITL